MRLRLQMIRGEDMMGFSFTRGADCARADGRGAARQSSPGHLEAECRQIQVHARPGLAEPDPHL